MRLVIIESPYAGNVEANICYARQCVLDSLMRGEAPIASHLLYTQEGVLDDNDPMQRLAGISAGTAWIEVADATAVYIDRGVSIGMSYGISMAEQIGNPIEYRKILYDA